MTKLGLGFMGEPDAPEMARLARLAERNGFESVWLAETRFTRDAITSATLSDFRQVPSGGITLASDVARLDASYSYGFESDYRSHGVSVSTSADLFDRNTSLALSYGRGWDDVCDLLQPEAEEATQRQRDYGPALGSHVVYTPQMVIDGQWDVVGSKRTAVERAIAEAAATPHLTLALSGDHLGFGLKRGGIRRSEGTDTVCCFWHSLKRGLPLPADSK